MKNEEKIIELLSEYLQKSDKHEEEMIDLKKEFIDLKKEFISLNKDFNEIVKRIDKNGERIDKNGERIDKNQHELRAMRLKSDTQQDVILKEILSLSKRVNALEDLK